MHINERVFIVTGASSGIGLATGGRPVGSRRESGPARPQLPCAARIGERRSPGQLLRHFCCAAKWAVEARTRVWRKR